MGASTQSCECKVQRESGPHQRKCTSQRVGDAATVVTVVEPAMRSRVAAVGEGAYSTVHAEALSDAVQYMQRRFVSAVVVSASLIRRVDMPVIIKLHRRLAGRLIVAKCGALVWQRDEWLLALGAAGVSSIVDVDSPDGCRKIREASADPFGETRASIEAAVFGILHSVSEDVDRFLATLFREAPRLRFARQLADCLGVEASTLMSRFHRAKLPSPKEYLARTRLLYACACLENSSLSIAAVANWLNYSSPQSFGRHVRLITRTVASDYRWRFSFERGLREFVIGMVAPFGKTFIDFRPIRGSQATDRLPRRCRIGSSSTRPT